MNMTKGYGLSVDDIGNSTPKELEPYEKAFTWQSRLKDKDMWQIGEYVNIAVTVAIDHAIHGNSAKSEYPKSPLLDEYYETVDLTDEEKEKRELAKMLHSEQLWQANDTLRGLPKASDNLKGATTE